MYTFQLTQQGTLDRLDDLCSQGGCDQPGYDPGYSDDEEPQVLGLDPGFYQFHDLGNDFCFCFG